MAKRKTPDALYKLAQRLDTAVGKALDTADDLEAAEDAEASEGSIEKLRERVGNEIEKAQDLHTELMELAEEMFAEEFEELAQY